MRRWTRPVLWAGAAMLVLGSLGLAAAQDVRGPAAVDSARMAAQEKDGTDWLHDGRTYSAQRFSPLDQINPGNVSRLGIAWYDDLDTYRGVEATPLYADGVLYNILPWNVTIAYDARTGKRLWTYDPDVPREYGRYACCEPVARGLAMWNGKIIIATLDGRLIALDARSGKPVWSVQTTPDDMPYSITGAPRVFDGKVVVGNSGGDLGIRGFVSAWDADTGRKLWKFFLTPGDPAKGPDGEASDDIMAMIRKTWAGDYWKLGGGANAWDSIAYDPKLNLVYIGTGNGSPLAWHHRSAGKGDNLFICSIVALDATTGKYKWHYQMVPEEDWDYTCTMSMISADLKIKGRTRQVIMQAPKNGFFYVLDRKTGALISAEPFVPVNWASGIDMKTGRPKINPQAHFGTDPVLVMPGPGGGHNWFPMAFSPRTRLAYFPIYESAMVYALDPDFKPKPFRSNAGWGGYTGEALKKRTELMKQVVAMEKTFLLAWDPVAQKEAWRVPLPRHGNGGVLVSGDLVFEGTTKQTFAAFDAKTGRTLWEMPVQSAPVSGPITYMLDGVQYVAVNAGWGGGAAQIERAGGIELPRAAARLLVFRLDGNVVLPPVKAEDKAPEPPRSTASEETIARGARLFAETCQVCHGQQAIGGVKDLRRMTAETHKLFADIVLKGIYADKGMASFADLLKPDDVEAIHAYVIARAHEDWGRSSDGNGPH
ncbi:PQQ-dependent dehydrogenase, methanol/ethanol family [Sphingobium lignivorans]|uniref:Quinohemoprotein ethanol dehydrogenase n=1 Tax=Sphingobium lignivorans TaxID=2735886 RepID=A0ABR6NEX6_9SPHN|nr:PQQ-dependent dehydrogenase, methanol/ethanol family [Sphingobium lignivorans]MBB5985192.1 quinohemoprotein ethanol dehydrogenase [Sphingobium lignivorans]